MKDNTDNFDLLAGSDHLFDYICKKRYSNSI
jgi:hypothetical protein